MSSAPGGLAAVGRALATAWGVASAMTLGSHSAQAGAPRSAMTFAELLDAQRSVLAVRFAPDGRRVAVAVVRNNAPTEGAPWSLTATKTYVVDLKTGSRRQVRGGAFAPTACQSWSPSGRFLTGFVLKDGVRRLAAWTSTTSHSRLMPAPTTVLCPHWAGDRLVYPTPPEGGGAPGASSRLATADLLSRWNAGWSGRGAPITVRSGNPAIPSSPLREGALTLADPASGRSWTIARGNFHSITTSPGGRLVAAVRLTESDPDALNKASGRRGELSVFRLNAHGAAMVMAVKGFDADYAGASWSPDGRRLLAGGRDLHDGQLALFVIDPVLGNQRRLQLPQEVRLGEGIRGSYSALRPSGWVGGNPVFIAAGPGELPAASDGRGDYGENHGNAFRLYVETPQGIRCLSEFAQQSVTGFVAISENSALVVADGALWAVGAQVTSRRVSAPDLQVLRLAEARPSYGLSPVYAIGPGRAAVVARDSNGALRTMVLNISDGRSLLTEATSTVEALSPSLDTAVVHERLGWAQRLRLSGQDGREILALNTGWQSRAVGDVRGFSYVANGQTLRGWIVLPPGYRGGALPALAWVYGGQMFASDAPADTRPGHSPTAVFSGQLWAAEGYAVIYPSLPVGPGANIDVAETLAVEAVAAVDAATAKGWVDPTRVGLIGHSFGGYSVAAILSKRSDRFRAGIAMSGVYDFIGGWGARGLPEMMTESDDDSFTETTKGYVETGQIGLGVPPFVDPAAYLRNSPFFSAATIRAPLMLTVGDLDLPSTNPAQSERLYAALRRTGNPAVLVRYWGEPHVQAAPWAVRDQWQRFTGWFATYVKGRGGAGIRAIAAQSPSLEPDLASSGPTIPSPPLE